MLRKSAQCSCCKSWAACGMSKLQKSFFYILEWLASVLSRTSTALMEQHNYLRSCATGNVASWHVHTASRSRWGTTSIDGGSDGGAASASWPVITRGRTPAVRPRRAAAPARGCAARSSGPGRMQSMPSRSCAADTDSGYTSRHEVESLERIDSIVKQTEVLTPVYVPHISGCESAVHVANLSVQNFRLSVHATGVMACDGPTLRLHLHLSCLGMTQASSGQLLIQCWEVLPVSNATIKTHAANFHHCSLCHYW